nr:hypothetical protein [Tanacetum cinerariifolium]GEZ53141.1 hypothetical protein [Tanacetum cinerariifolium]
MEYHSLDKRLTDLIMMVLVRQTEECDMMLHMEKSDMLMLVAEIKVGDKTADDVDKLACLADVVKPSPFNFGDFGVIEWDELREIIPKKKNQVVKDLMNSLSKRYERLRTIPKELGIRSNLPAPGQVLSITSGRKRKHIELDPDIRIPRLKCNGSLPEGVPFVNNMVIEEPKYEMFFIDVFGDEAFQRMNDMHKVDI